MKSKKKSLLTSLLAIVLCLSLITGSTFALFTSTDKVDITVKSGKVKIAATVDDLKLYSATIEETEDVAGTIATGNHAATYYYEEVSPKFTNGGTAEYADGTLTLNRVTPGDKVTFKVGLTNSSNVNIKYRVVVTVTNGLKLFRALKVNIDGSNLTGVSRTGNWTSLAAEGSISDIPVEIYMPIDLDGEEYMDISTAMSITVEAVQGNAKTTDEILTTTVETEQVETTVEDSQTTAATEIKDSDELVIVTIPANTTLTSETDTALAVKVKPQDTSSAALEDIGNFTVLSNKESASYDVSVLKVVSTTVGNETVTETSDAIASNNGTAITVKMFIGAGLTGVELYHTHEGDTTKFTSVANENDVDTDKFYYNAESGYVTFKTLKFSEYTVVYNADYAYEKVDEVTGESEIIVLPATETAGVYVSTDEEGNEVHVTVTEDENGNVTEEVVCEHDDYVVTNDYWEYENNGYAFFEERVCSKCNEKIIHEHELAGMYCTVCGHMIPFVVTTLDLENGKVQDEDILNYAAQLSDIQFAVKELVDGTLHFEDSGVLTVSDLNYLACFDSGRMVGLINNEDVYEISLDNENVSCTGEDIANNYFADYYVDFSLEFNVDMDLRSLAFAGAYNNMAFAIKPSFMEEEQNLVAAGTEIPVMGSVGFGITYDYLSNVQFLCGLYIDDEVMAEKTPDTVANFEDATVTLRLIMYKTEADFQTNDSENRIVVNTMTIPLSTIVELG